MSEKFLIINAGSSSLKFSLYDMPETKEIVNGYIEKMCFVPYASSKTQYADPQNNILIDDDLKNLEEWEQQGGNSIFFNKDLLNYDSYGNKNNKFTIINDLLQIYVII